MRASIACLSLVVLLGANAASAASASKASNAEYASTSSLGLLYGRVTMASGTVFEGRLRWGDEEASWIDFFNSAKIENPWHEAAGLGRTPRRIEVFGVKLPFAADPSQETRQFIARFGDIRRIDVGKDERATVTMKSGVSYVVQDGSNDIGADVVVWDAGAGEQRLRWTRIAAIDFLPTPPSVHGPGRLYGTVRSRDGEFTGALQWNMHECLATDVLHGDSDEARMQIPFAEIRSIDRDSDSAIRVEVAGGKHLQLTASAENGVFVDDSRFGRVLVGWEAVQHIDFASPRDSSAYGDFPPGRPLAGSVTDRSGKNHRGRLVFDLDEAETWEFLNGNHLTQHRSTPQWPVRDDDPGSIQYSIPMPFVAAVVPIDNESARLLFHDGREITLEGETDVGEWNGGMLIFEAGAPKPVYIEWKNVQRVDFER